MTDLILILVAVLFGAFCLLAGVLIGRSGKPLMVGTLTINEADPTSDFMSFYFDEDLEAFKDLKAITFKVRKK